MKNKNKANAGRTQIADISVAGKELSEEHLRIVGGGLAIGGINVGAYRWTNRIEMTCTVVPGEGWGCCKQDYGTPGFDFSTTTNL